MWLIKGRLTQPWIILWTLDGLTHRMVDSPHDHAEQRVAGTEELHFLSHEVFLLGLGFARNGCGNAARRSHLFKANPIAAASLCGNLDKSVLPF